MFVLRLVKVVFIGILTYSRAVEENEMWFSADITMFSKYRPSVRYNNNIAVDKFGI